MIQQSRCFFPELVTQHKGFVIAWEANNLPGMQTTCLGCNAGLLETFPAAQHPSSCDFVTFFYFLLPSAYARFSLPMLRLLQHNCSTAGTAWPPCSASVSLSGRTALPASLCHWSCKSGSTRHKLLFSPLCYSFSSPIWVFAIEVALQSPETSSVFHHSFCMAMGSPPVPLSDADIMN